MVLRGIIVARVWAAASRLIMSHRLRDDPASDNHRRQGGEGRVSEAENLRSPREIQSIFYLLGRTGKFIIFIIWVGIWRCNEPGKR